MNHVLEIEATATRNSDSQGAEVWLRALKYADGTDVPLDTIKLGEGWETHWEGNDLYLLAAGSQPGCLHWSGTVDGAMTLIFGSHSWSGIVKIRWNGREDVIDLYSTGGYRVIELPARENQKISESQAERQQRMLPTRRNAALITAKSPPLWRYLNPLNLTGTLMRHRYLIWQFTQREVMGRYKGSFLGIFWSFLTPLLLLAVYTFVFGVVFKGRWGEAESKGIADFALKMFCGLIVFNVFSECINRAPGVIVGNQNYVKKVVFPLEIFPVALLGGALIHALISAVILVIGQAIFMPDFPATMTTVYFLPLVLLPLIMSSLGLGWILSSMGVFIRDLGHAVSIGVQLLFYVTPVFYPIEALPEWARILMKINPLAVVVTEARNMLVMGKWPDFVGLMWVTLLALLLMQFGYAWFMITKRGFSDVI